MKNEFEKQLDRLIQCHNYEWNDIEMTISYDVLVDGFFYQSKVEKVISEKEYFKRKLKGK